MLDKSKIKVAIFLHFYLIHLIDAQTQNPSAIRIVKPTDCDRTTQYFDIARLQCNTCPANSVSTDLYNCRCKEDFYFTMNNGGGSVTCAPCPSGFIQSLDGFNCVSCDATCKDCAKFGGYRTDFDENGNYFVDTDGSLKSKCVLCDKKNSISTGSSCASCKPLIFIEEDNVNITSLTCDNTFETSSGILIYKGSSTQDPNVFNVVFGSDSSIFSYYFSQNLKGNYRTCKTFNKRNSTACQSLGNLCVLNLYSFISSTNIDACRAFSSIPKTAISLSNNLISEENILYGVNMPWLYYTQNLGAYKSVYDSSGTNDPNNKYINLKFTNKCEPSYFSFYASEYRLNGSLIRYDAIDISRFQLCNFLTTSYFKASQVSPFSATNYIQSCKVSADSLLKIGAEPVFYDLYLKYSESSNVFPIPVVFTNYKDSSGSEVNKGSITDSYRINRRFFLAESISSKTSVDATPKYVRYAKSIIILFELAPNQATGRIYPPVFIIDYDYVSTDDLTKTVSVSFEIQYKMNLDSQILGIWISVGVMSFFIIIWSIIRTWIWNRRSGKLAPDMITLFKFAMFTLGGIGDVFFVNIVGFSLYWLILYKGQGVAFVVIPQASQEDTFRVLIIVGFALKLIDIVHLILTQSSYDVFFIDWERPKMNETTQTYYQSTKSAKKGDESKENLIKEELKEHNKISCWRTLFVSNEWNEIQTYRKINPTIQLIFVLLFLKVINLEALTTADCNTSIYRDVNSYQAPYSGILRVAMAASMYLGVGLFQYFLYVFLYIRCIEDKICQFIDFCSVANISMFIMTHTQFGYYIHGRSPHGNVDVSMQGMSEALLKEQNDVTAKRGLEQGSDHQTFSISISDKLSKQYSRVMNPLKERSTLKTSSALTSNEFEKRMLAYTQLNRFLMAFIDNILRDMKYIVTKRNLIENLLDLEFKEPLSTGFFYADDNKSFANTLFCGQERKLFVFDLLLFLFIDYFAQNYVLAAFIVYIIIKVYNMLRDDLGKRNLSRKTLVDKRFLI